MAHNSRVSQRREGAWVFVLRQWPGVGTLFVMRTYKANRWLWCLASVVVFAGIGLIVQFDNKGVNAPLGILVLGWVRGLLTGVEPLRFLPMVAGWVALWFMVALVLGWFLQSLVVIAASKHERKKPTA